MAAASATDDTADKSAKEEGVAEWYARLEWREIHLNKNVFFF